MVSLTSNPLKTYELRHIHPNDMCRICMLPSDYLKNSGHELTSRICKMLHTSTQIDVSINDGYPQVVCNNCYKQLNETYKFVLLAKNTSRKFRKIEQTVIKPIQETLEQPHSSQIINLDSKSNLLLIDSSSNDVKLDEKKTNNSMKIQNNVSTKQYTLLQKRFVLRSDIKKDDDIIIIENNNSIDLTETTPILIENCEFEIGFDRNIQQINEKPKKRTSNENKKYIKNQINAENINVQAETLQELYTPQKQNINEPTFLDVQKNLQKEISNESKKILVENVITNVNEIQIHEKLRKRLSNEDKKNIKDQIFMQLDKKKKLISNENKKNITVIKNIDNTLTKISTSQPTNKKKGKRSTNENKKNYSDIIKTTIKKKLLNKTPPKVLIPVNLNKKSKKQINYESKKINQKTKKQSKNIIKIKTKYLTRTVKREIETNSIPNKEENKSTEIKSEPPSPKLDDILSAVGLVRKISTDIQIKYECESCEQKFSFIEPYKRHLAVKHKLSPYKCRLCGDKFGSRSRLKKHKDTIHKGIHPYRCLECDATFKIFETYLLHKRKTHIKKLPYPCKICKNNFMTKEKLLEHTQKHTNNKEKPDKLKITNHHCEYCEKKFRKNSDLIRHLRVHTGEKPFVCNVCNTGFQQAHNLTKHMVIHTKEKAFICDICEKHFGRNDSMLRHMLTHSMEKPFVCVKCKKCFTRQSQLDMHYKKNHGEDKTLVANLKKEI